MTWGVSAVAAATVVTGYMGSQAAGKAADAQTNATNQANATAKEQFERQIELNAPFREAGLTAQNRLLKYLGLPSNTKYNPTGADFNEQAYLQANPDVATAIQNGDFSSGYDQYNRVGKNEGRQFAYNPQGQSNLDAFNAESTSGPDYGRYARDFSMSDFQSDPGYAFRIAEGNKALNASAAARGGLISGNALKAAQDYGQNAASQEYTNAFNRYQVNRSNQLNPLQSLLGAGQTATGSDVAASGNYGNTVGSNTIGGGNAQASGYVGSANSWSQALGTGVNAYNTNRLINMYGNRMPTGGGIPMGQTPANITDYSTPYTG